LEDLLVYHLQYGIVVDDVGFVVDACVPHGNPLEFVARGWYLRN
jgi:hypothetical protein